MSKQEKLQIELLKKYAVAILHMRRQLFHRRLGIVLGAGVSKSIGFADWNDLISEIAKDDQVNGINILEKGTVKTITTQLLYQKFKSNYLSEKPEDQQDQQGLTLNRENNSDFMSKSRIYWILGEFCSKKIFWIFKDTCFRINYQVCFAPQ